MEPEPLQRTARLAGAVYLLCALTAPFGMIFVPGKLIVKGNATATAHNLLASEMLLRTSIVTDLISTTAFAIAVLLLYKLLRDVDRFQGWLMVMLGLLSLPFGLISAMSELATLNLLHRSDYLAAFDRRQLEHLAMLIFGLRGPQVVVAELFWGLWLFPFGWLVLRSGFLPRFLGWWLLANGAAYVALFSTGVLLPSSAGVVEQWTTPLLMGEVAIMLWLVVAGVRRRQPVAAPVPA
jgi:Domain of unknown function (DUF4386)